MISELRQSVRMLNSVPAVSVLLQNLLSTEGSKRKAPLLAFTPSDYWEKETFEVGSVSLDRFLSHRW